jgi:hypothetical protein
MDAPAHAEVYSEDKSPGKCFAIIKTSLYPLLNKQIPVVKPDTPAPLYMSLATHYIIIFYVPIITTFFDILFVKKKHEKKYERNIFL